MNILPKILLTIDPATICRLEADTNYTIIRHYDGTQLLSGYSLKVFAELFDKAKFVRINRSNLVNTSHIKCIETADGKNSVRLNNNISIPIPRRRSEALKTNYPTLF
jgi:DNA-binding LytR/AlgR family response regulator